MCVCVCVWVGVRVCVCVCVCGCVGEMSLKEQNFAIPMILLTQLKSRVTQKYAQLYNPILSTHSERCGRGYKASVAPRKTLA